MVGDERAVLAISVGNTNTRLGVYAGDELVHSFAASNGAVDVVAGGLSGGVEALDRAGDDGLIVLATVNEPASDALLGAAKDLLRERSVHRVGLEGDVPVPIRRATHAHAQTGVDRLLNAWAAWRALGQACVVVDAGSAVTVDFVDGEGTFQGGAILPGARAWLGAIRSAAPALPEVEPEGLGTEIVFGKDTREAMLVGLHGGLRGAVRGLVERYALAYEAYPQVVVTGGDAELIFEGDELFDRVVPDLTLRGIVASCAAALSGGDDEES